MSRKPYGLDVPLASPDTEYTRSVPVLLVHGYESRGQSDLWEVACPVSIRRRCAGKSSTAAIKVNPVATVAAETGICQATLFRWKRQALIEAGIVEGIPSVEADELAAAQAHRPTQGGAGTDA